MKLCNDTITVFNAKLDQTLDATVYVPTVIHGVSWYGGEKVHGRRERSESRKPIHYSHTTES